MYCPSCGSAATPGLSYCKQCGAGLKAKERNLTRTPELPPGILVPAMVATFIFGLGAIAGLIAVMKACNLNEGFINGVAVLAFLMMVIIEAIFIRLLWRAAGGPKEAGDAGKWQRPTLSELDTAPPLSVTEHTTRTLEPEKRR